MVPLSDLTIRLVFGAFELRSKKLGVPIRPHISSAHNFEYRSLAAYRFLGLLQQDGYATGNTWGWGSVFASAPYLPRVEYGRTVLSRAQWRLGPEALASLTKAGASSLSGVADWCRQRKMPRIVVVAEADNELPLDLRCRSAASILLQFARKRRSLVLTEFFQGDQFLAASDGTGAHYYSQIILPFRAKQLDADGVPPLAPPMQCQRAHPLSQWLYMKYYGGTATIDRLIVEVLGEIIDQTTAQGLIDRWFFVRYADPDPHLRIRFRCPDGRSTLAVLAVLSSASKGLGSRSWRHQADTYVPELNRYGGREAFEESEQIFHADSDCVLRLLRESPEASRPQARWEAALIGVLETVHCFMGEDRRACLRLLLDAQNAWAAKFAPSGGVDRALSKRYRLLQGRIQQVISNPELDLDYLSKARALLRVRNSRILKHVRALYELGSAGALVASYESIVLSHVHMHVNRILRSTSSGEELVLYHYLVRHLKSMLAREQHSKHAPDREG